MRRYVFLAGFNRLLFRLHGVTIGNECVVGSALYVSGSMAVCSFSVVVRCQRMVLGSPVVQ